MRRKKTAQMCTARFWSTHGALAIGDVCTEKCRKLCTEWMLSAG